MHTKMTVIGTMILAAAVGCNSGSTGAPASGGQSGKATPEMQDIASAAADLNGDGYLDLAVLSAPTDPSSTRSAYVSVYYGPIGQGALPPVSEHYDTAATASSIALADVNGDGIPDIVVGSRCHLNGSSHYLGRVHVIYRAGQGGERGESDALLGLDVDSVAVADMDGDGKADLIASGMGYLYVARGLGAGDFDGSNHVSTSGVWSLRKTTAGVDVAVVRWAQEETVDVYRWNGGSLTAAATLTFSRRVAALAAADLDNDGDEDLIAGTADGAVGSVAVALAHGASAFHAISETPMGPVLGITTGDFDGDGNCDLGVTGFSEDGSVASLLGTGTGVFQSGGILTPGQPGSLQKAADLDGDGKCDLVLCAPSARVYHAPGWQR